MSDTASLDECEAEIPYNGRDEDCDGADLVDVDGDGWDAAAVAGADCDDTDATVNPDAEEICANLVDDDCDGLTDEGCALSSAGPPDPGGFSWICGTTADVYAPALVAALLLASFRRFPR